MEPESELEPLTETVSEMYRDLEPSDAEDGTYLPKSVVEEQRAIAGLSDYELRRRLMDAVFALAARHATLMPADILEIALSRARKITNATWEETIKPELRRLRARELEKEAPDG